MSAAPSHRMTSRRSMAARLATVAGLLGALLVAPGCGGSDETTNPAPTLGPLLDRVGRPFVVDLIAKPFGSEDDHLAAAVVWKSGSDAERLSLALAGLADLDGLDGVCGNQLAAGPAGADRYRPLATTLLDDRLLVDTRVTTCGTFFALETGVAGDCGGLAPDVDQPDALLSLLLTGARTGVRDGVDRDGDGSVSSTIFPFLIPPTM